MSHDKTTHPSFWMVYTFKIWGQVTGSDDQVFCSSRNSKIFWDPPISYPMISLPLTLNLRQYEIRI